LQCASAAAEFLLIANRLIARAWHMPCTGRGMKCVFLFLSLFAMLAMLQKVNASNMILTWIPSTSPNVAGYTVYYGTIDGNSLSTLNAGNVTSVTISNLSAGATYYFAATAYTSRGNESALSTAIVAAVPQSVSSAPPLTNPGHGGTTTPGHGGTTPGHGGTTTPSRGETTASGHGGGTTPTREGTTLRPIITTTRNAVSTARSLAIGADAQLEPLSARIVAMDNVARPAAATEPAFAQAIRLSMPQTPDAPALAAVQFSVEQGHWYEVQATSDFQKWISIWQSEIAISNGWSQFTDPDSKLYSSRFYRLVSH
jgi:hypothetical protein